MHTPPSSYAQYTKGIGAGAVETPVAEGTIIQVVNAHLTVTTGAESAEVREADGTVIFSMRANGSTGGGSSHHRSSVQSNGLQMDVPQNCTMTVEYRILKDAEV